MGLDMYLYTDKSVDPEKKIDDEEALAYWRKCYPIDDYFRMMGSRINEYGSLFYISRHTLEVLLQNCLDIYIGKKDSENFFYGSSREIYEGELKDTIEQLANLLHERPNSRFIYLADW